MLGQSASSREDELSDGQEDRAVPTRDEDEEDSRGPEGKDMDEEKEKEDITVPLIKLLMSQL